MGNQLAKAENTQKRIKKTVGRHPHQQQQQQQKRSTISVVDNRNSPAPSGTYSAPTPVRHQVVLSENISTLPLLSSSFGSLSGNGSRRRYPIYAPHKRASRHDNHSVSSFNTSDDEPGTPNQNAYGQSQHVLSSSLGSTSSSADGWPTQPSLIVFDSAIATAENAADDLKKRRAEAMMTHQKNNWVYEYGEEKEYNRQLRQHYVLKQVFAGNAHVPMDKVHDILECACGTGLWALEMAQAHPNCKVVGIDIVPPTNERSGLPTQGIPKNVTYQHVDLLTELPHTDCSFDYVYERDVAHIMPVKQWPVLLKEFYRVLRPGGYLELVEYDLLFRNPGPVLALVNEWYKIAASTLGVDPGYTESIPRFLLESGFEEIEVKLYDIPIGEWPTNPVQRQYGFLYKEQMKTLFKSMQRWWLSELEVSEDEYVRVCNAALDEFEEYHSMARWKILTARKPQGLR